MRQPLTMHEVLAFWLVSQVGEPKRVKPTGYSKSTKTQKPTMVTVCLDAVSQVPGYDEVKADLVKWAEINGLGMEGMLNVNDFLYRLQSVLQTSPIYLIPNDDDGAVKPVEPLTVSQFAEATGIPSRTVRDWCHKGLIRDAYPYRSTWMIPEHEVLRVKGLRTA